MIKCRNRIITPGSVEEHYDTEEEAVARWSELSRVGVGGKGYLTQCNRVVTVHTTDPSIVPEPEMHEQGPELTEEDREKWGPDD